MPTVNEVREGSYIELLAGGLSETAPCGEDLSESVILEFQLRNILGRQTSFPGIGGGVPDWGRIRADSLDALSRTRDLRLLPYLGAAVIRLEGFPAFTDTLEVARYWLTELADTVFPRPETDYDGRIDSLGGWIDFFAVLDGVASAPFVEHAKKGWMSLRDWETVNSKKSRDAVEARDNDESGGKSGDLPRSRVHFEEAFARIDDEALRSMNVTFDRGLTVLADIEMAVRTNLGARPPDLGKLRRLFALGREVIDELGGDRLHRRGEQEVAKADVTSHSAKKPVVNGSLSGIRSREDAIAALEAVSDYFKRVEPSSPVPLLVDRARRLVDKSFLDLLEDLVPDAVDGAQKAAGVRANSGD